MVQLRTEVKTIDMMARTAIASVIDIKNLGLASNTNALTNCNWEKERSVMMA